MSLVFIFSAPATPLAAVMLTTTPIRIGGVPEHYNAPFHRVSNPDFTWISYPGGTGAMLEALEKDEIDMAVLLTEGIVKQSVCLNGMVKMFGTFVDNPLPWGVHVRPGLFPNGMNDLNLQLINGGIVRFGISRFGSGSHLMAIVHASRLSDTVVPSFHVVDNMAGAAAAMKAGEIDVFLWDITTADIHTREGIWEVIGTVSGDWPAFVFGVKSDMSKDMLDRLESCIANIGKSASSIKSGDKNETIEFLKSQHHISTDQAVEFLDRISWNCKLEIKKDLLDHVVSSLYSAKVIDRDSGLDDTIVLTSVCRLV